MSVLDSKTLRQIPIFGNMNDSERRQLAEISSTIPFKAGDIVLHQGQSRQNLWIVLTGQCEVYTEADAASTAREPIRLALLEPYSNFGEMSFFHAAPHSASVRATTEVTLLRIERADYQELVLEGASAAYKLACNAIDSLADRLRRMDDWVADLVRHGRQMEAAPVDGRVPEWSHFRDKLFTGWNL